MQVSVVCGCIQFLLIVFVYSNSVCVSDESRIMLGFDENIGQPYPSLIFNLLHKLYIMGLLGIDS